MPCNASEVYMTQTVGNKEPGYPADCAHFVGQCSCKELRLADPYSVLPLLHECLVNKSAIHNGGQPSPFLLAMQPSHKHQLPQRLTASLAFHPTVRMALAATMQTMSQHQLTQTTTSKHTVDAM